MRLDALLEERAEGYGCRGVRLGERGKAQGVNGQDDKGRCRTDIGEVRGRLRLFLLLFPRLLFLPFPFPFVVKLIEFLLLFVGQAATPAVDGIFKRKSRDQYPESPKDEK